MKQSELDRRTCLYPALLAGLIAASLSLTVMFPEPSLAQNDPALNCEEPQAQQEMNFCAARDFDEADAELNALYKKVRAAMAESDAEIATYSPELTGAVEALVKGQRGWIEYRDGHCEAYGFQARGGSMEPMLVSGCKAELTRTRTRELQSLIDDNAN